MPTIPRPTCDEHASFFSAYIDLVPEGDVLEQVAVQFDVLRSMLAEVDDARADFRYADGKWSLKEVIGHVIDMERLFSFRALAFARQPGLELPGCDQDEWMADAGFDQRSLADLMAELAAVRRASLTLFASFTDDQLSRGGTIEGHRLTVRSLAYILTGHELHHLGILKERYLAA